MLQKLLRRAAPLGCLHIYVGRFFTLQPRLFSTLGEMHIIGLQNEFIESQTCRFALEKNSMADTYLCSST